jgi:hypothetical protein
VNHRPLSALCQFVHSGGASVAVRATVTPLLQTDALLIAQTLQVYREM